jgi:preprotein translocase subunit SecE
MAAEIEPVGVGTQILGPFQRLSAFLADVRNEMRKVNTPSMKEVQATTMVVIITVIIFGLYFWVMDNSIGRGVEWLLSAGR